MIVGTVVLTLVLMDTCITLMIYIVHLMRLSLTKLENITLIIITIPLPIFPLYLILLVCLGGYTVNLCDFYFYKLMDNLTSFFTVSGVHLAQHHRDQEFWNFGIKSGT